MKHHYDCREALQAAGFSWDDACALRRISMTLHRWHELECGNSNNYASWCITRGYKKTSISPPSESAPWSKPATWFEHDENGKPYLERHIHSETKPRYESIPDRERGALKRLVKILKRYPGFDSYVQGDPRGCALYILRPADLENLDGTIRDVESSYTRGIAVCK